MKNNIVGDVAAIILLVITAGLISALFLSSADTNIQARIKDKSVSFVDSARAKGEINPSEYLSYVQAIGNCGDFKSEIGVVRTVTYRADDGTVKTDMVSISQEELLSKIYIETGEDEPYLLNTGDRVYAKVERTSAGLTSLLSLIGRGGQSGDTIFEYSGQVYHDGTPKTTPTSTP